MPLATPSRRRRGVLLGEPLDPLQGALDGGSMELEAFGELRERRFGGLAARVSDEAHDVGLFRHPPVGVEHRDRVELATGRRNGPLEVGRLGVEDPVELAAQRAGHLAGLELEQRARRTDPAQEGPDRLAALPGHDAATAPEPPRGRQADLPKSGREHRGVVRRRRRTRDGCGRRPGSASRGPGTGRAARPYGSARPRWTNRMARRWPPRAPGATAPPGGPPPARGRHLRAETGRFREPVARSRRVDRRQLVAQGRDEVTFRASHVRLRPHGARGGGPSSPPGRAGWRRQEGRIVMTSVFGIDDVV